VQEHQSAALCTRLDEAKDALLPYIIEAHEVDLDEQPTKVMMVRLLHTASRPVCSGGCSRQSHV